MLMESKTTRMALRLAAAFVLAIAVAAGWLVLRPAPQVALSGAMLNVDGADIGGPFELTAHTGARMTSAQVIDRPALIYFGYTSCTDICPIDVQVMAETVDLLADRGIEVRPVFITVDPARDTVAELADYAGAIHPKLIALTGTEDDIRAAANAFRIFYQKAGPTGSADEYEMQHTRFTYLMTPGQGLTAMFRQNFPPAQIADDVARVLAGD